MTRRHDDLCGERMPAWCDCDLIAAVVQRTSRECIEIAHSAPLLRLRDDDGTEYVARDALMVEIRAHALRRSGGTP
jgi:hypothetical protein